MRVSLREIPLRETLHFLGWQGTPVQTDLIAQIRAVTQEALSGVEPRIVTARFALDDDGALEGTVFLPAGRDVRGMLAPCHEAVLMAATLGGTSERLLLRAQAQDATKAVLLDAVLSAGIEAVLDEQENALRESLAAEGLYLTDRYSPGYGDMPLRQTREIAAVLKADRAIGLTVSSSGIMIPRKSVTAILGVSKAPVPRRPHGCEGCAARENCALRRTERRTEQGKAEKEP